MSFGLIEIKLRTAPYGAKLRIEGGFGANLNSSENLIKSNIILVFLGK